ncbi:TPA: hypothetical protein ACGY3R_001665 [Listeria monocytogenes]|uniref:DUF2798 domain-containing protein n=1 Tax=Listeria monocytogenes TaxID=1639 RepID=A0A7Y7UUG1_LISMN|nr:hypothetical protein [Listeria monocytogenes]EAE3710215.1 hypothetical protein [Listeria monocytogenes serotype 1/2b]EAF4600895.1 hypothetical protein [Listeria monocytogenes serotype 1/2a]EAG6331375.1 hypothetical protein [Listeria monocytogenes CFSAN002346]EAG6374854.1 hypothetical protein [Listeria monocytogenes CFSAN002356]EGC3053043.1 hypothetical protein [Listeria monocytogenes CFSAN002357]EHC6212488.1 hypothetical protein [Listeria monocytogenes serotype 4b]
MYSNRKEKVVFTLIMCSLMILCMSSYNIFLENGIGANSFMIILKAFVPFLFIGFLLDFFVVGKIVYRLHALLVSEDASKFKKIIMMQLLMVTFMCVLMSTLSLIVNQGEWSHLGILILRNYFVALFLQIFIVSPFVRLISPRIFALL